MALTVTEKIAKINEKIEKQEAKIAKREIYVQKKFKTIENKKKQIAKSSDEDRIHWLNYDIHNCEVDANYAMEKEIPEMKAKLEELNSQKKELEDLEKNNLEMLKPFKSFMDDLEERWNIYDLERKARIPECKEKFMELREKEVEEIAKKYNQDIHEVDCGSWYGYRNEQARRFKAGEISKEELNELVYNFKYEIEKPRKNYEDRMANAVGSDWKNLQYKSEEEIRKDNARAVYNLIIDFISRVEKVGGKIKSTKNLHVGPKCLEGTVDCEKKIITVFSTWAGGYNIQRLHVRVYVH